MCSIQEGKCCPGSGGRVTRKAACPGSGCSYSSTAPGQILSLSSRGAVELLLLDTTFSLLPRHLAVELFDPVSRPVQALDLQARLNILHVTPLFLQCSILSHSLKQVSQKCASSVSSWTYKTEISCFIDFYALLIYDCSMSCETCKFFHKQHKDAAHPRCELQRADEFLFCL